MLDLGKLKKDFGIGLMYELCRCKCSCSTEGTFANSAENSDETAAERDM
ncbi:hypothetical protein [Abyssisolibacter fermentans]|nr:hypothetical protein [Abyssisolibacter fermentans]